MAKNDIRVHIQSEKGTTAYPITTGQTFLDGEVVRVVAAGTLSEAGDDPATVAGISMGSSQGMTAALVTGTVPDGTMISIYKPTSGQLFISDNFAEDGGGTAVVPTLAHVGDVAGFTLAGGTWSVDTGTVNLHVEITDVLDVNGQPLGSINERTAGTGVSVVFGFI